MKGLKLEGLVFNRLTAIEVSHKDSYNSFHWKCLCECGNYAVVCASKLKSGYTKSCGCLLKDKVTTHAMSAHPFYKVYHAIKARCLNPNSTHYDCYGGRGITICEDWLNSFENFKEDMFPTYKEGLQIDRIDVNGNYSKENCRWVSNQQNSMNTRGASSSTSKYKGVCWVAAKRKWLCQIMKDRKRHYIGYFIDEISAAKAYNEKAKELFGEYAYLNNIEDLGL